MTPKVDTFEHDIADEIKRKEASLAQINAASQNRQPEEPLVIKKPFPWYLVVIGILFTASLGGLIWLVYFYFTDSLLPPSQQPVDISVKEIPKVTVPLSTLSPTLQQQIGPYVSSMEKQEQGYILTINSYGPVFAYMARNEASYIEELANVISPPSATMPVNNVTPPTPVATTSSSVSTTTSATSTKSATTTKVVTTQKTSTSTMSTTTSTPVVSTPAAPSFKDITINNQNMRMWVNGSQTVVYAFVSNNKVLISKSTEGILTLRSAILH